jgi:hypothetical protein
MNRMGSIVGLVVVGLIASGCGLGADHDDPAETSAELSCETFVSVHGDPTDSFEGYATPREAVAVWMPGTSGGPPSGEWVEHQDRLWVLIDEHGNTVGRTEVEVWAGNALTTLATERYAAFAIEYCE